MSDRIAVMRGGLFEQIGTPTEVYDSPRTSYVAQFVGTANILHGTVHTAGDTLEVACAGGVVPAAGHKGVFAPGSAVTLAVRSEQVEFSREEGAPGIPAVVKEKSFAGGMLRIALACTGCPECPLVIASRHGIDMDIQPGDAVHLTWAAASAVPVDAEGA